MHLTVALWLSCLACFSLVLTGCKAEPTPAPLPTPVIWQVQFTPTLRWMGETFNRCTLEQAGVGLRVSERPANALKSDAADSALRWDAPANLSTFAAVVGWDELAVIVHPRNPLRRLSLPELQLIFSGQASVWSDVGGGGGSGIVQAWVYPPGEDIQQVFEGLFTAPLPVSAFAHLAPDAQAMRQAVSVDPLAVGYLPRRWVDGSLRAIELIGVSTEKLRRPILAISPREPQAAQRAWLDCLTKKLSQ